MHQALLELKNLPKTKEKTHEYIQHHITKIAVHFYTNYGFPIDNFKDKIKQMTTAELLTFVVNFYKNG